MNVIVLIKMTSLSTPSILKPPSLIFRNCLSSETFPDDWKKANIVPVNKKDSKQLISNYRPVSLPPICLKFFEKLIFNIFSLWNN